MYLDEDVRTTAPLMKTARRVAPPQRRTHGVGFWSILRVEYGMVGISFTLEVTKRHRM